MLALACDRAPFIGNPPREVVAKQRPRPSRIGFFLRSTFPVEMNGKFGPS